jgi:hypothetical protein
VPGAVLGAAGFLADPSRCEVGNIDLLRQTRKAKESQQRMIARRSAMAVTSELGVLHRAVEELNSVVQSLRIRYGDVPAVRRLVGDVDRLRLDAGELDGLQPPTGGEPVELQVIDDSPLDPSLWQDADDEGLGGYHGSRG